MNGVKGINQDLIAQYAPNPGRRALLPELDDKAQLALLCRMLFKEGWNDHTAGHITYRLPNGTILANPWELTWDEVTASDILTLNSQGEVIEGDWNITPAIDLHMKLHQIRPDVHVVAHNHPHWSGIWASLKKIPAVYDQASAYVDGDLPLFEEYEGTLEEETRTQSIVDSFGDAKWALLANHGSLVVGADLRQAHLRAVTLEWRCKRAYQVELLGGGEPLHEDQIGPIALPDQHGFPFLWEAMARRELREDPSVVN